MIPTLEQKLAWLKLVPAPAGDGAPARTLGLGEFEIGFQRTNDILDEGMEVFVRSCRSAMGIAGDSLVGIFTADGDMVNGSCGTYLHAVIPPLVIKFILHNYRVNPGIRDGDLWFANDAVYGGIHNPDQLVAMPVFFQGELIAWTAALVHTTETGASEPGGMPIGATARFEEGLNLPPTKIGENFQLRDDIVTMFEAFGIRAPQMVAVDLKARCTTADRVRTRLLEFCEREGVDYIKALFRRMLEVAEQGARARIRTWADGVYRSVHFADAVGLKQGLVRSCYMTVTKDGDHLLVDFSGTGPETPSSYNAHPQAAIGHFANYVYEYLFHDLPISNATFAPIDFKFEPGSCLYPDVRAATSNSVMIATGVMSAVHNCFAKAVFSTEHWRQAGASQGNGGNAVVLAGMSQWSSPFADMLAYSINTEGQGALPEMDGMNAFGFPWCLAGRAPDVELVENEFPLFIPISSHWKDSAGHGKHRGGVGTAQLWVAHHVPMVANGLRALHTAFGNDVIVTAAADDLAAAAAGDPAAAGDLAAAGAGSPAAHPRVVAAVEATRRLAVTADDAALAVALCGPARLAAQLGRSPVDQAALETCGAVLLALAKAFLEAGANLLLLVEAEPLPAASAGGWRSAVTPLVNVARFHQAAAAVVLADPASAAIAPRGAVVCLPPPQAGPGQGIALSPDPAAWPAPPADVPLVTSLGPARGGFAECRAAVRMLTAAVAAV